MDAFGLVDKADENRIRELAHQYLTYLDDAGEDKLNSQKIDELIKDNGSRLIVDIDDLRRKHPERAKGLITNFVQEIVCLEQAVKEIVARVDNDFAKEREFHVGFEGSFGDRHVNPRSLKSNFLGNMVCCEGVVTKCSLVRPKIVQSVHFCPVTKKRLEKKYTDFTSYDAFQCSNAYPKEDENKNPLETEFGLCTYKDHQMFSIQELPENAPPGHLPRNVDIVADDDLADRCKPGDRVHVIGLYRVLPNKQMGTSTGNFRSVLIANNIRLTSKEMVPVFDAVDIKNIRRMSRHKDIFDLLARSLAPSIYGHEEVKKAILCLLLGGLEKVLPNGTRLRGDINVLLIGDPSVAKSQLLRYVMHTAPRVVATTGRGSSGVGLTAAVVHDTDTGDRRLEAGAMVLADRGIVCIDEFDKMSDIDRTAIHEVMEQGRVSISKAGIQAKLNARCSVLAAANPVYGRYNLYKTPMENIGMQDSLLSRFDLIFVMLDSHDAQRDRTVAENVLKLHRYRAPGEADGAVLPFGGATEHFSTFNVDSNDEGLVTTIYEKNRDWTAVDESSKILSTEFMRKYIHMAKATKPILTEAARKYITEQYSILRSNDMQRKDCDRTMPVTARQLETMIRLSTAMAKARLAKEVELVDAKNAYELLHFACFKEKTKERMEAEIKKTTRSRQDDDDGAQPDSCNENIENETHSPERHQLARAAKRRAWKDHESEESSDLAGGGKTPSASPRKSKTPTASPSEPLVKRVKSAPTISVDRYRRFREVLRIGYDAVAGDEPLGSSIISLNALKERMQEEMPSNLRFTEDEFEAAFEKLEAENACMRIDGKEFTLI